MPQPYHSTCFLRIETKGPPTSGSNTPNPDTLTDTLYFTNIPDDIGSSKQANINPTTILGRSETIKTYGSSGGRAWNLNLQFFATDAGASWEEDVKKAVVDKVNWCESLVYPQYINRLSQGPPLVRFIFGDYLNVLTLCTSVQTSVTGPWLVQRKNREDDKVPTRGQFLGFTKNTRVTDGPGGSAEILGDIILPLYATVTLTLEDLGDQSWGHEDVRRGLHNGQYFGGY